MTAKAKSKTRGPAVHPHVYYISSPSARGKTATVTKIYDMTEMRRVMERELQAEHLDTALHQIEPWMRKAVIGDVLVVAYAGTLVASQRLLSIEFEKKVCATLGAIKPSEPPSRSLGDDPEPDSDQDDLDRRAG